MHKHLRMLIQAICLLLITLVISFAPAAHAYTQEQKNQAKAWLSAHGYPPTEDGAWQAYSDWLDGQWWDEFGSPAEYFGWDEEEDEDEDDGDEEEPTAATQKSQRDDAEGQKSDAETLVDMMKEESSVVESSPAETEPPTSAAMETTVVEEPTAATQANLEELLEHSEEMNEQKERNAVPFAFAGIGAVAVLLVIAIVLEKKK